MATSSSTPHPTILLLDLPPKAFVGINLASFNSSPNFHGITNLPPGLHFLYTGTDASLSIRHGHWFQIQPQALKAQIFVLRWSHDNESLDLLDGTDNVAVAAARSIPSLQGRGLVDYSALRDASANLQSKQAAQQSKASEGVTPNVTRQDNEEEDEDDDEDVEPDREDPWPRITSYISPTTLSRILSSHQDHPTSMINQHLAQSNEQQWAISSISTALQDTEKIPGLSSSEASDVLHDPHNASTILFFVHIDLKRTWPDTSVGRDRTEKARDKSWYLGHLIDSLASLSSSGHRGVRDENELKQLGAREYLAELQFCFVTVLTLANYSCLEQWKRLLSVLFGCRTAVMEVEGYFVEAVKVLRMQLDRVDDVDGGLFEMGDEMGSSWLRSLLATFRAAVDEVFSTDARANGDTNMGLKLKEELKGLEIWLGDTYGWDDRGMMLKRGMLDLEDGERVEVQMDGIDEEEETGEYAPVVVEI